MKALLAVLLSGAATFAGASEQTSSVRAARYYAADLDRALLQLRAGAALIQQRRPDMAEQELLALLDALTLFPQRLEMDPSAGLKRKRDLDRKIGEASKALLREAGEYDVRLFGRYGATLRVCPDEDAARYRESADELMRVNFTGFQALSGDGAEAAKAAVLREEAAAADALRSWAADDCVAARKLGEHLMQLMFAKLQRWSGEDERVNGPQPGFELSAPAKKKVASEPVDDRDIAHAVAGNFVTVVATELELTAYPESAVGKLLPAP